MSILSTAVIIIIVKFFLTAMKLTKNTSAWGQRRLNLGCWNKLQWLIGFWVIRHSSGSERGPQTGRRGMCFLVARGCYMGQIPCAITSDALTHTHTHTRVDMRSQECFSSEIREKQTVRKHKQKGRDNMEAVCPYALWPMREHDADAQKTEETECKQWKVPKIPCYYAVLMVCIWPKGTQFGTERHLVVMLRSYMVCILYWRLFKNKMKCLVKLS